MTMDRTIKFCDVTLRDGEQTPGVHFTPSQKLDIAKRLRRTGIDIIEAGFPASSAGDFEAVSAVAQDLADDDTCTVSALARMTTGDIDAALSAVEPAKRKRLHVFIATSDIHLENKLHMTREQVLARIYQCITYAKANTSPTKSSFPPRMAASEPGPSWVLATGIISAASEL